MSKEKSQSDTEVDFANQPLGELPVAERRRDLLIAAGLIGGMIALQLYLAGGGALFSRDFWLDEIFTYRIASDPDFLHSLQAVQAGIDLSPPGYQILARGWTMIFGISETSLRSLAFTSIMVFLAGLYGLLRLSANRWVCCAAVLAVWSHPLIVEHAFDARFYGPWLAAVVWYCVFWQMGVRHPGSKVAYAGLAVCSLLACSFHYFGVVSLGLVVAGEVVLNRPSKQDLTRLLVASLTGPAALLVYVPVFFWHQMQLSETNWIPDPSLVSVSRFVLKLLFPRQLVIVVLAMLFSAWGLRRDKSGQDRSASGTGIESSTGLIAMVMLVPLFIVVACLLRPAIVPRYAIPVVACLAPAVVVGLRHLHRNFAIAAMLAFSVAGVVELASHRATTFETSELKREVIRNIEEHTQTQAVFFETPNDLYVVCQYAPHLAQRCFFLDYELGELPEVETFRWRVFNRDHTRAHIAKYPQPARYPWDKLKQAPAFFLVLEDYGAPRPPAISELRYPGFQGRQVAGRLYLMTPIMTESSNGPNETAAPASSS